MSKFIIEARNVQYERIGLVENYTEFEAIIRHNAVGTWSATIPGNTPEVDLLQPGNGIIVRIVGVEGVAFSGPITKISRAWSGDNPGAGSITISGVTDDQLLFERVTYPIPNAGLESQTDDRYILQSNVGTLMSVLVSDNCGFGALAERKYPELDVDSGSLLGEPAIISTRFDVLGEKLQELANSQGIGFRVRQGESARLRFELFEPQNKGNLVFGKDLGNLQSYSYDIEAPTATRLIFAAQGEGKDRYFTDAVFDPWLSETWDDRDERIEYQEGGEGEETVPVADQNAYKGTRTLMPVDTAAQFTFTGSGFRVYGQASDPGDIFVYLLGEGSGDGTTWPIPDPAPPRTLLGEFTGLAYGEHEIYLYAHDEFSLDYIEILDERAVFDDWRRNSERFYDRRDIPVAWNVAHNALVDPGNLDGSQNPLPADPDIYLPMLEQATLEGWDENGAKGTLSMEPIDTDGIVYGKDYRVGDIVTVAIDGATFSDVLREVRLSDGSDGPRITPTIGDSQASSTPTLYKTVRRLWSKVTRLEAR